MWEQTYTQNLLALSNPNQTKPIYNVTIWNVNVPVDTLQGDACELWDQRGLDLLALLQLDVQSVPWNQRWAVHTLSSPAL
ncbi:hypothetical protein ABBQ38_010118 [Trebouxia sp. C0009 RCD-2024]